MSVPPLGQYRRGLAAVNLPNNIVLP